MQYVANQTSIPRPRVHACDLGRDYCVGTPVSSIDEVPGNTYIRPLRLALQEDALQP